MSKPPQSKALASTVAESLAAASARHSTRQAAMPPGPAEVPGRLDASRDVLEHEALTDLAAPQSRSWWRRFRGPLVGGVVVLAAGWLWLLESRRELPAPGPAASHLLLINSADAIALFRANTGRFPTGAELDSVAPDVSFQARPDGGFELGAPDGSRLLAPPHSPASATGYELEDGTGGAAPRVREP